MIWHNIQENPPVATKTGNWDGFKSDKILVATQNGGIYVAEMYEGVQDGQKFRDFFDPDEFEITNVIKWTEIDNPF